jgi:hypothetical protein
MAEVMPPVSHRAITHFDEDVIGLGVWSLHLDAYSGRTGVPAEMSLLTNASVPFPGAMPGTPDG